MDTAALADIILRVTPDYADLPLDEIVACVRHHIGGCREIEVEEAIAYLNE